MELIVKGTIGGLATLYPQTLQIEKKVLFDSRAINPLTDALGQEAYALQFHTIRENRKIIKSYCIFSKYIVVRDQLGDGRMGYIAFSIFCTNDKKISGNEMQSLLDAIASNYCSQNVKNNTLGNAKIDWKTINSKIELYSTWLRDINPPYYVEAFDEGKDEPAYVYYRNNAELHRYFDDPYQEEYKTYKQILFVKNEKNNSLNALRHDPASNLTGKIDNPEYRLDISSKNDLEITVKFKGIILRHGDKIKRNHEIEIAYSKQYRLPPHSLNGKVGELCQSYPDYIEISKDGRLCIKYRELEIERRTVKFDLYDSAGSQVRGLTNIHIVDKIRYRPSSDELVFEGDDLGKQWYIFFEKDQLRGSILITPDNVFRQKVTLKAYRKISITAMDVFKHTLVTNIRIVVDGIYETYGNEIELYGEEVKKEHVIAVFHKDYKPYTSQKIDIRYKDKIEVRLTPKVTPVGVNTVKKEPPAPDRQVPNHWGGNQSASYPPGSLQPDKSKSEQKSKTGAGSAKNNQQPQKGNFWLKKGNFWSK